MADKIELKCVQKLRIESAEAHFKQFPITRSKCWFNLTEIAGEPKLETYRRRNWLYELQRR